MDDYSALAQRVVGQRGRRAGCLVLSRDGLVLGAYPGRGREPRQAGLAAVRHARRARQELRRVRRPGLGATSSAGPYAAFAVAGTGVRPGRRARPARAGAADGRGEPRATRDTAEGARRGRGAPSGKPRTSLHPAAGKPAGRRREVARGRIADRPARRGGAETRPAPQPERRRRGAAAIAGADAERPPPAAEAPPAAGSRPTAPAEPPAADAGPAEPDDRPRRSEPQKLVGAGAGAATRRTTEVDRVLARQRVLGIASGGRGR